VGQALSPATGVSTFCPSFVLIPWIEYADLPSSM
jgi:hypothetical protein